MIEGERMRRKYIVAGSKPWNKRVFNEKIIRYPGQWFFIDDPKSLTVDWIASISPRYIFFLHWSCKVPEEIIGAYECVCFHMTDVPYGRGGSPLQNLIVLGNRKTKLTALRMVSDFDSGPVYLKQDLSLEGLAEEIYIRASNLAAEMILRMIQEEIDPVLQTGEPTVFERREPHQSEIPPCSSLQGLFDFIRMLDAEGYPKAFLTYKGFRYEFSRPALYDGRIVADVKITPSQEKRTP